jgi:hypothetical protein
MVGLTFRQPDVGNWPEYAPGAELGVWELGCSL